jgi:carboxyl-terminal processing protease
VSKINRMPRPQAWRWVATFLGASVFAACGGGGGDGDSPAPSTAIPPSSSVAQQCVNPRPAGTIDPLNGRAYGDVAGSAASEKAWVRSWINETYLWWDEVPALNPANYGDAVTYFADLKTPLTTASGKAKDQFHFTYTTQEWVALSESDSDIGYGFNFAAIASAPPRNYVIAYTDAGSPADTAGVARGDQLVTVDGLDFSSTPDYQALNAALFPSSAGQSHTFTLRNPLTLLTTTTTLASTSITHQPVPLTTSLPTPTGNVAYIRFDDHTAAAEASLVASIQQLQNGPPIDDLILDIRYNGGGLLDIASELAYMIAGPARTTGQAFDVLTFNSKNPFNESLAERTTPFISSAQGFSYVYGAALPTLGLSRVFVLTGNGTCSASEAIINGLRGVGVQVIQIGGTTCGKPYGFYPQDNCGTTYFSIQFQGVNAAGFGDYSDGFVPNGAGSNGVAGCTIDDDFNHNLGDPAEARLSAALGYQATGSCTTAASLQPPASLHARPVEAKLIRSPLRENRFYRSR